MYSKSRRGCMSCGFLLWLGLSHAAQVGNAASAAEEKKGGQSDHMKQVTLIMRSPTLPGTDWASLEGWPNLCA